MGFRPKGLEMEGWGVKGGELLTMVVIGWKEEVRVTLPTTTSFTTQELIH